MDYIARQNGLVLSIDVDDEPARWVECYRDPFDKGTRARLAIALHSHSATDRGAVLVIPGVQVGDALGGKRR